MAIAISRFRFVDGAIWYKTDKGATFCQVRRIIPDDIGTPWVTSGTQKWKGDNPNFIARAIVIMLDAIGLGMFSTAHCPVSSRLTIIPSMRSMDAVA